MSAPACARCRPTVASRRLSQLLYNTRISTQTVRDSSSLTSNDGESRKPVTIFSGIQPTGIPHLGNYLGALRQWRELQDSAGPKDNLFFSVVDLHAITMPQDAPILKTRSREMLAALLAVGLDPNKSTIFLQSAVSQHTELMWILSCTASFGYLMRMTQWKSKIREDNHRLELDEDTVNARLKLGLFSYPVLQAADILLYRATHVPVGDDQKQHIEFARECVTNFNANYPGGDLVAPETITVRNARIMSLVNPLNKMSKSSPNERSRILITAPPHLINTRIRQALTDSRVNDPITYDPEGRPGVANLLRIWSECDPLRRSPAELAADIGTDGSPLRELKEQVTAAVTRELDGVGERYREFLERKGGKWVQEIAEEGAEKARVSAAETMRMVKDVVGFAGLRK